MDGGQDSNTADLQYLHHMPCYERSRVVQPPADSDPLSLCSLVLAGEREKKICQLVEVGANCLPAEHRTAKPWNMRNLHGFLEEQRHVDGRTLLHVAVEKNFTKLVSKVLEGGARPDIADEEGRTPLMVAAALGHEDIVVALLSHLASVSVSDKSGWQPLHHAMCSTSPKVVSLILDAKAEIKASDRYGRTPLAIGATMQTSAAVAELLRYGAKPFSIDHQGRTPLDHADGSRRDPKQLSFGPKPSPSRPPGSARWDGLGGSEAARLILREERWKKSCGTWQTGKIFLSVADRDRLHAALPPL